MQKVPNLNKVKIAHRKEGIQKLSYGDIVESQFVSLIVGKPGQGKSSLIEQLLLNQDLYFQKFEAVLVISPSTFQQFQPDPANCTNVFSLPWLTEKLLNIKNELAGRAGPKNVLIVFDDVISHLRESERSTVLQNLFFNRRNIIRDTTISIILTSQKYNITPPRIRSVLTSIYAFNLSPSEWNTIRAEHLNLDPKELRTIIQQAFSQSTRNFIYIKLSPQQVYINFKRVYLAGDMNQQFAKLTSAADSDSESTQPPALLPQKAPERTPQPATKTATVQPKPAGLKQLIGGAGLLTIAHSQQHNNVLSQKLH